MSDSPSVPPRPETARDARQEIQRLRTALQLAEQDRDLLWETVQTAHEIVKVGPDEMSFSARLGLESILRFPLENAVLAGSVLHSPKPPEQ